MELTFLTGFYDSVGVAGAALIAIGICGVYLVCKNIIYIHLIQKGFTSGFAEIVQSKAKVFEKSYAGDNPLLAIIWDIVRTHANHSDDMRSEVAYLFHRNFESISRSLCWIRLITVISPLLGLLGTIFGMVRVFETIAENAAPDATVLAAGIWEALLTTAMGLSIAIPMLILYYFLLLRFKGLHIETMEYSYRALDLYSKNNFADTDKQ